MDTLARHEAGVPIEFEVVKVEVHRIDLASLLD